MTPLPNGTVINDANKIIRAEDIFSYNHSNQFGHGQGSVAGFSDIFRYKLLYEMGGWWTDMDITCLRPLDFEAPFVFRTHTTLPVVGNIMKCPAGSQLMLDCYKQAVRDVNAGNKNWLKPIEILNANIKAQKLEHYILPNICLPDHHGLIQILLNFKLTIPADAYFIHWMNEEWRSKNKNKNHFRIESTYGSFLQEFGVVETDFNWWQLWMNNIKAYNPLQHIHLLLWHYPKYYYLLKGVKKFIKKRIFLMKVEPSSPDLIFDFIHNRKRGFARR
ncbi:MAG: glycosyltransferase [Reichenbachiella sp.]|uniref:glycosyltransferase n=1 Tax=Reichenbachiella sp. TaxID=2184521 RepID=UPI003266A819